jgi:hypothetical protein
MKINLLPLDEQAARVLADRRGMTVDGFLQSLIREEAAIEVANWRTTPQPATAPQQDTVSDLPTRSAQLPQPAVTRGS